jgi:hypothetical protein
MSSTVEQTNIAVPKAKHDKVYKQLLFMPEEGLEPPLSVGNRILSPIGIDSAAYR